MSIQTAPLPCNVADHERVVMSSAGTPFEITGFRTEKFENHEGVSTRIDSLSDSPAVEESMRIFSGRDRLY